MPDSTYWAALTGEELADKLYSRVDSYADDLLFQGMTTRYSRSYQYYYGLSPSGVHATSQVLRAGDVGELAAVRVNHSRALLNTLLNLIIAPKLSWQPKAVNIDYDSLRATELASAVLEYYWTEKNITGLTARALEEALAFSEGFILAEWRADAGDDYAAVEDTVYKSGDVEFTLIQTWNVIRDPCKRSYDELDWVIARRQINRYDLIAQYPDLAEKILDAPKDVTLDYRTGGVQSWQDNDDIPVYEFFHKRTPAMPQGKQVRFLNRRCLLSESELQYAELPLYRVSAGEMTGTPYAYTTFWDILGIQELTDSLHTIAASNQTTFGGQSIAIEEGSEVQIDQLPGGMKAFYYRPGSTPPVSLQLTKTPPELFQYLKDLKTEQELVYGLNSVARGEPQSGELSGSALALLQSQALQQSSHVQGNYLRFVQSLGNCLIQIIQKYASTPKKLAIVGKNSTYLLESTEYTGQDLVRVKRVQVEIGNPLAQTSAGRTQMAQELMGAGLIKTPEQYTEVLKTGRLEPLTQGLHSTLMLIRAENEQLAQAAFDPASPQGFDPMTGQPLEPQLTPDSMPPVIILDDHALHIREHATVLSNPDARRKPEVTKAVLAHIAEHERLYMTAPPQTLMLVGQQPPMMPGGPPPAGPGPAGPSPDAPPADAQAPKPPKQPKNAATGQRWDAATGGGAVPPPQV